MLEHFRTYNFREATFDQIATANSIIEEYQRAGLTLTLRQLYYQFVARDLIPNSERSYKSLGSVISKGREAGLISWRAIEDRGRNAVRVQGESDPRKLVSGLEYGIVLDPWQEQDTYVEVWIEKDALIGTIEGVCDEFRVTHMACKGYLSASEAWRAGKRFERARARGKDCVIIHMGDHDPSGIDMSRDNEDRSYMFSHGPVELRRIALNMNQIEEYAPPPNPAKLTDTRASTYVERYGDESWELDALEPRTLSDLVRSALDCCITDPEAWNETMEREEDVRGSVRGIHEHWDEISELIGTLS